MSLHVVSTDDHDASLHEAATAFHAFMKKRFHIKNSELTTTLRSHKDTVLVDWRRRNELVASTPVQHQKRTLCCWAYALADVIGTSFAIRNSVLTACEQFRCAPYDLVDWVYSIKQLKEEYEKEGKELRIDKYGTYPCRACYPLDYVIEYGISLLTNYEVEIGERTLRTNASKQEFEDMRVKRGPRIFFKTYSVLYGSNVSDIEVVLKTLHQGVAYGEIKVCNGCDSCTGFSNFEGTDLYDEPISKNHQYGFHALLVLGIGNRNGKDFLRVRNTHGPSWGHLGIGDIPIKYFVRILSLSGAEKRMWDGKQWVLADALLVTP